MKTTLLAAAAVALTLTGASAAPAQSIASDVRCLLLGNVFAKNASDEKARQAASQSMLFYAGRLDGRANAGAIAAEMRTQSKAIDVKAAGAEMSSCATRVAKAQSTIQNAAKSLAPAK